MKSFTTSALLRMGLLKFIFLLFGFLMMAHLGWSNTRYVDSSATSGSNNGLSWPNAYRYLSDALAAAQTDATIDTILVAEGTYYPTGAQSGTNRSNTFAILRNNLKIFGGFQPDSAYSWSSRVLPVSGNAGSILSGDINLPNDTVDNSYHVMAVLAPAGDTIDTAGVVVDGFTITGGNGFHASGGMTLNGQNINNQDGAGIYIGANATGTVTSPTIRHCLITRNYANYGGGIYQANYGGLVSAVLDNCVISENVANGNGAGIFIQANPGQNVQGKPVIKNTLVADNMAGGSGGGIYFNNSIGHLTLNQVVFRNNEASSGGGFFHQSGKVIADSCEFYSNVATNGGGGGWYHLADSAILSSVSFIGNTGFSNNCNGGGFNNQGGNAVIKNAVFKGNSANHSYGGGWYNYNGKVFMVNALFSGNTADYGGAWFSEKDSTTQVITNASFSGNMAVGSGTAGGAIRTSNKQAHLSIRLRNSILWGNSTEIDGTVTLSNTIVEGGGNGGLDMNPLFVMPVSFSMAPDTLGDYHLSQCSPAINVGNNDSIPTGVVTDLDGNVRIFNTTVDLGAYEFQSIPGPNKTRFVDINATGADDGSSWTNAFTDLQNAINHSCPGDTLWVAQGTYLPTRRADDLYIVDSGNRDDAFVLRNGLKIFGGFDGTETQLSARDWVNNETILSGELQADNDSANNAFHVVIAYRTDSTTMLDGFTIQRGQSDSDGSVIVNAIACYRGEGGGLYTSTSSSVFAHLTIQNNYAKIGGGAGINAIVSDGAIYKNLVIQDNSANDQGAGIRIYGGRAYVMHSTIRRNHCNNIGGGMFVVASGNAFVTDCTFEDNFANIGGGIFKYEGYLEADRCSFLGNQALNGGNGGGFGNFIGNFRITNSLFTGNVAGWGAALYYYNDTNVVSKVVNTTIAGNQSVNAYGGAIGTWGDQTLPKNSFTNGIIWGNTKSVSGSINITNSIVEGGFASGTNILDANPLFVAPEPPSSAPDTLGDYHLQACSPAINVGINDSIPAGITTDLDSNARNFNATVDLGAYEFQDTVPEYSVVYVDSANGNDGNDGASWATAFKTLSYALTVVQDTLTACYTDVDSILVAEGTYYPTGTQSDTGRSSSFAILRAGLKIYGGFPSGGGTFAQRQLPTSTAAGSVLSGDIGISGDSTDNSRHVVIIVGIDAGTDSLILDGFRIQDGFANGTGSTYPKGESLTNSKGAGIYTSRIDTGAVVILNHCVVTNNNAESHGGGIVANNSFFYLLNSSIAQNQSGDLGGGLYDAGGSNLVIRNCDFTANKAIKGGGIYNNTGSSPIIENCSILLNRADSVTTGNGGGGIYNADGSAALVINSTISGNIGNTGGGWYNASTATAKLYNVLLSGNLAISKGAAWYSEANDSVWLVNTTIAGNHVNYNGGGSVFLEDTFTNVYLQNSIIWNNSSTLVGGLTLANSIVQNGANGGWDWNPQFVTPVADSLSPDTLGNYRLSACSPALNAGDSAILPSWLTVDLDGQQRIIGTNVDLGAYEFPSNPYAQHVLFVDSSIAASGDGSSWSSALQTLSEAFQKADDCSSIDSILVAKGTYFPTGTQSGTDRDAGFIISKALKIYGGYAPGGSSRNIASFPSILSGDIGVAGDTADNSYHVMVLAGIDSTVDSIVVDGLTMVSGVANGSGSITINGKSISQDKGGGLYIGSVDDSLIVFRDCKFLNNSASAGGGGLYISGSKGNFNRVVFAGNRTETAGGGIYCYDAKPVLTNCLISGNKTYSGSTASVGGIQNSNNGKVVLINTTISGNDLGGLRSTSTAMFELHNSLVYGNAGFGISGDTSMIFYSLVEGLNSSTNGNLPGTINPLFVAPENPSFAPSLAGNYHVLPCSPTIDMGDNFILSSDNILDLDRNSRIENGTVDLGAYEFQGTAGYPSDTNLVALCFGDSILFGGAYYANSGYYTDTVAQATGCDSLYVLNLAILPPTDTLPVLTYDSCIQVTYGGQVFLSDTILVNTFSFAAAACDSTFQEIHIHVYHPDTTSLNKEICFGDTAFVETQIFTTTGQYQVLLTNSSGCDSVVNLDLLVYPENHVLISEEICAGDSYLFAGINRTISGSYSDTLTTTSGCDSIVTLNLTVNPTYADSIAASICPGGSYVFGTNTYSAAGFYTDTFATQSGCDSVVTLSLSVNNYATGTISAEICDGDSYLFAGINRTISGSYSDTVISASGCDSIVTLNLTVNPTFADSITASICPGGSYVLGTNTYTTAGVYVDTFSTVHGCDSIVTLNLSVNSYATGTISAEICDGDSYLFAGINRTISGSYSDTLTTTSGCDSIVTLTLTVNPTFADTITASICPGGSYVLGTNTYTTAGVYVDSFTTIYGCDSVVTLNLSVNNYATGTISAEICAGDSYLFAGINRTIPGTYSDTLTTTSGCDSIVTLTLTVNPSFADTITASICPGGSYVLGTNTYTTAGVYVDSFTTIHGCDSVVTLNLSVNSYATGTISAEICDGDSYLFAGINRTISGSYSDTLTSASGCDSIVTLTLTVNPSFADTITASICPGGSYVLGTNTYTTAGVYVDTFSTVHGCDSVVTLNLSVNSYAAGTISAEICDGDSYLFAGINRDASGTYSDTVTSSSGCDSIVTLNLTVNPTYVDTIAASICPGGSYVLGTNTYTTAGVYVDSFTTIHGCDSIVTLNLSVNSYATGTISAEICDGDSYLFAGINRTIPGTYSDTLTTTSGCDSIVTLTLTVNPTFADTIAASICPGGSYVLGTNTYSSAGVYVDTFTTIHGCDSVVTLSLSVNNYATGTISAEICDGDSYLFAGINRTSSGSYSDTVTSSSGCDSIVTLTLTVLPPPVLVSDSFSSCDSIIYNGTTYSSSILLFDTLANSIGCDSVYMQTQLIVYHSDTTQISMEICQGDTAFVDNQSFTASGNYQILLTTQNGCDSLVQLSLTVHPVFEIQDTIQSCPSALPYTFDGQSLNTSGNYTGNFTTVFGCDSIVHLTFTVVPDYQIFDTAKVCPADLPYVFGGQSLLLSGNYSDTLTSQSGCDSIINLTLEVMPAPQNLSMDTSGCGAVLFEGNTYNQSVVLQDTLHNMLGCDSLYRNIHIVVWNNSPKEGTLDSLDCDVVYFHGRNYYSDTVITQLFKNIHGCDSFILTTRIHVLKGVRDTIIAAICQGESYAFGGQKYTQSGLYSENYPYWNGCDSISVLKLTVHELPVVEIYTEPRPLGYCIGDEIMLEGRRATSYRWWTDYGREYGSGDSAFVRLVKAQIVFFMEGRDENACVDTATMAIEAGNCCQLFIPNAFSPNGDGRNDKFGVETNGHPNTVRIEIYNRYGQRVFVGFSVDDRWDGLINGQPAPMGEYYYRISGTCTDNSPILEKGSFTLIR